MEIADACERQAPGRHSRSGGVWEDAVACEALLRETLGLVWCEFG